MQAAVDIEKPADPIATTEDCRYCWMCRQACPVGHVTARETLTPHGWALTIASVKRGTIAWTNETVDVLYACADCGLCRSHCITDRPLPEAIAATRAEVVASGKAPAAVKEIDERLKRGESMYPGRANGSAASELAAAPTSPPRRIQNQDDILSAGPAAGAAGVLAGARAGVGLFVGDAVGDAEIGAVLKLLAAVGIRPAVVGRGRSNGVVASSLGLRDTAISLGRAVLDEISGAGCRELLVIRPEDRFGFSQVYQQRLGLSWPGGVSIRDVTALLAAGLAQGSLKLRRAEGGRTYAYHDPCHTARVERDDAAPRALLAAVLGEHGARRLFWRERRAHPCGATGGLQFTQPAIAGKLADARLADAHAAGATTIITDDPVCAAHLKSRPQRDVAVLGLYQLLADHLVG